MRILKHLQLALLLSTTPTFILSVQAKTEVMPFKNTAISIHKNKLNETFVVKKTAKGDFEYLNSSAALLGIPENWFNLSSIDDKVEGVGAEKTYAEFGMPQSEDIIVAVVDSGVDVNHEDLQGKIWINSDEIAENGLDDDHNGYVDDVMGWNFIGGRDGMAKFIKDETLGNGLRLIKGKASAQVGDDTLEVTREMVRLNKLKAELEQIGLSLEPEEEALLAEVTRIVEANSNLRPAYLEAKALLAQMKKNIAILREAGVTDITIEVISDFETSDEVVLAAKTEVLKNLTQGLDLTVMEENLASIASQYANYNPDFNTREIVGDDYTDQTEKDYGNNDVIGPDSSHGTHVSGIIAAVRNNNLGVKGIATNVKIMVVRCVPNGDERDKDVANSIRYAVDNGAKIINMSFGKAYSPYKGVVDDAMKYASDHGVLLFHAAGNDADNNNTEPNFPNKNHLAEGTEIATWMEIGASAYLKGRGLPANFSNYGDKSVNLFSPGVKLLSTTPDNTYNAFSGTSMASPAAAGVAALVLSYKPDLAPLELKEILLSTSKKYPGLHVAKPGNGADILFSNLSINGGIIDAYNAVKAVKALK